MVKEINPKKAILFVITQAELGGAQKFFLELLPRLDRQKYEVTVAIGEKKRAGTSYFTKTLENQGLKIIRLNWLKRNISFLFLKDWLAVFELRKLIKKLRPDVLFLNSSKAGFIGSFATVFPHSLKTKNYRLRTIYRIGGWTFNDPWPWWKKQFWIMLEKISASWKDVIIVNNENDLKQAEKLKIKPKDKLTLIYNGLDVYKMNFINKDEARIKLFEKAARQSAKVFQAKTIIGTIANFYPSKGLDYLIETAEHFKNNNEVVFVIIGDGQERPRLEKMIAEKMLEKKVLLLGQIPDAYRLLPAFDIFLLSSVKEGFPWVILEAMSAKLPIIATKVGAVPEIIEDGKNGILVDPIYPKQMAEKIEELVNDDHLRQEIGIQAHQTILFKFPLEKMVREIESVTSP